MSFRFLKKDWKIIVPGSRGNEDVDEDVEGDSCFSSGCMNLTKDRAKVLLYGLDGVSWELLDPLLSEGLLPNLATFLKKGSYGVLETTIPTLTMPAVPALYTGMNPGELGIFSLSKPTGDIITINDIRFPRLWDYMKENELRSLVFNAKFTYPPDHVDGIMISAGPLPSKASPYTHPEGIREELEAISCQRSVTGDEVSDYQGIDRAPKKHYTFCLEEMNSRFKRFLHLCEKEEFPFIFNWEGMTDAVQHRLWYYPELLKDFFSRVDENLGQLMERFPDYNIFLVSDHGFHGSARIRFHVNTWLEELGYLKRSGSPFLRPFVNLAHMLARNYIPDSLLESLMGIVNRTKKNPGRSPGQSATLAPNSGEEGKGEEEGAGYDSLEDMNARDLNYAKSWRLAHLPGIDYQRSKAFQSEQWGIDVVNCTDEEYERIRADIIARAHELQAPSRFTSPARKPELVSQQDLGKVIQLAAQREDIFSGAHIAKIPDIVFLPSYDFFPEYQLSSSLFSRPAGKSKRVVPGDHNRAPRGIFAVSGPQVRSLGKGKNVRIIDIAPTILHLMRLGVPTFLDGAVYGDIVLETREVQRYNDSKDGQHVSREMSRDEQQEMREHLKNMGYVDDL